MNNCKAGEPFRGFLVDLSLYVETPEGVWTFIPKIPFVSHFSSKIIKISFQV